MHILHIRSCMYENVCVCVCVCVCIYTVVNIWSGSKKFIKVVLTQEQVLFWF